MTTDATAKTAGMTPCPICRKPSTSTFQPFCSQRCADVDLGRWLGERYVIPGPNEDEQDGDSDGKPDGA